MRFSSKDQQSKKVDDDGPQKDGSFDVMNEMWEGWGVGNKGIRTSTINQYIQRQKPQKLTSSDAGQRDVLNGN
jgi:hypothetical protein